MVVHCAFRLKKCSIRRFVVTQSRGSSATQTLFNSPVVDVGKPVDQRRHTCRRSVVQIVTAATYATSNVRDHRLRVKSIVHCTELERFRRENPTCKRQVFSAGRGREAAGTRSLTFAEMPRALSAARREIRRAM